MIESIWDDFFTLAYEDYQMHEIYISTATLYVLCIILVQCIFLNYMRCRAERIRNTHFIAR